MTEADATLTDGPARDALSPLVGLLRCLRCRSALAVAELHLPGGHPDLGPDGLLVCTSCQAEYPLVAGTARMLRSGSAARDIRDVRRRTAESFAYEWKRFGAPRAEWRRNFLGYMNPLPPEWFAGKLVLDVGTGSGRHSREAHLLGSDVVAIDLGESIDVARRNLPRDVLTVQADAEDLPFDDDVFDLVMSLGVLHHLPDPGGALKTIARHARPGATVRVYLYWVPEQRAHRAALRLVSAVRRLTVRMPHPLLHALCYPLAGALFLSIVMPYRVLRRWPTLASLARRFPLKAYADYPFGVLVNDQFDRFSAPLERRFTEDEVRVILTAAGLQEVKVVQSHGWLGVGQRPGEGS